MRAHAKVAPLRLDVGGLEPSSSVVIEASEATLRPVSYPAYLAGGWPRCRSARASLAACLQHLVAMASKRAAGGGACTRSAGVMGMLRVDPVADREEGLWSAARDDHGAWPRPQKKARTESRWLSM